MIEGCIVAKLVFGYLKEEGFSRTCSTFQEECSYFHNGNREIDMVLLTADLKTILDDYSRPKEAGKENTSSSTAVIKSLWKELDILIGQLKYATIPVAPRSSLSSQSARTRRLNYVSRPWKNTTPLSQELACQTTSNPAVVQQQTSSVLHGKNSDKLPLPRLSSGVLSQNQLLRLHQNQVAEPQLLTSMSSVAVAPFPTFTQANTSGPVNITEMSRSHHTRQIAGCNLTISTLPTISLEDQTFSASNTSDFRTENPASLNSDNQVENSADKVMDYGSDASNKGGSDVTQGAESAVCSGLERSKIASAVSVGELSPTYCNAAQDELHLKSPKRKCVQPKKRTVQGDAILLSVVDSPVKSVTCTSSSAIQDVEFLENPSWDMTAPQYFVDKLLNTPLLQEKLAENINKVVGSSRQQPHIEVEESSSNMMIADVTNANSIIASSESSGADIPVEDILEQMQADPAFDALFSMFGLDALGDSSFSKESPTDAVADGVITSTMPGGPMEASNSLSTASNLHSSATSIVTDALLLLAGSPQKPPQPMLCESGGVPHSENMRSLTPPIQRQTANGTSTDRCPATKPSSSLDQGMMTSLPYVRALDFSVGKDDKSTSDIDNEMGRRKGMKNKKGTKQRPLKDNSTEQIQSRHRAQAGQTNNRVPLRTINLEGSVASSSEAKFSGVVNQSSRSTETASCLADLYTTLTPCARSALSSHAGVTPPSLPSVNPATVSAGSDTNIATAPVTSPINFANRDFLARPSIRPTPSSCTVIGPRASTFIYNSACLMPSSVCTTSQVSSTTASPTISNMQSKPAGMHLTTRPTHSPVSLTCQGSYHTISPAICTNPRMGSTPLPANVSCQGTDPNPSSVNLSHKDTNPNHSCTSLPYSLVNLCTQAYTSATSCTSAAYSHPHTACPSTVNLNSVGVNPSLLASTSAVTGHGISTDVNVGLAPLVSTSNTLTLSSSSMLETRDMFTGEQWASEMLSTNSLNASNMLHTLAVSHANSKRCSFGGAGQLSKGNVQCLTDGLPSPPPVLLPEYLQSKELWTSRKSGNICKDKSEALNVAPAGMDNACKESVVSCDVHDSSDYQKRNASKPITRDHECSGFTQTRTAARKEPSGKRQKNLSSQHKVKKCKGSRVVKKLKSKQDSIHFPKNLNVEEFLSKLCYEEK